LPRADAQADAHDADHRGTKATSATATSQGLAEKISSTIASPVGEGTSEYSLAAADSCAGSQALGRVRYTLPDFTRLPTKRASSSSHAAAPVPEAAGEPYFVSSLGITAASTQARNWMVTSTRGSLRASASFKPATPIGVSSAAEPVILRCRAR